MVLNYIILYYTIIASMAMNPNVTNSEPIHPLSSTVSKICDDMIDKLYNVNQQRRKKHKKATNKYITMNATYNPHLNSPDNTTYYVKNEPEHLKNSKIYIKITQQKSINNNTFLLHLFI
jgi:hypothetical protein